MKQFIVLVSTICLGILIATFVMGFKTNANTLKNTATTELQNLSISSTAPSGS